MAQARLDIGIACLQCAFGGQNFDGVIDNSLLAIQVSALDFQARIGHDTYAILITSAIPSL
jgi:hypothetical protein